MKWVVFYRCPNNGKVIRAFKRDKEVICTCGLSNPKVPKERTPETGTHIARFLEPASQDELLDEMPSRLRPVFEDLLKGKS